eukprot:scaffold14417_cov133-Skeletonema_marinoi.AAC.2
MKKTIHCLASLQETRKFLMHRLSCGHSVTLNALEARHAREKLKIRDSSLLGPSGIFLGQFLPPITKNSYSMVAALVWEVYDEIVISHGT